MYKLYLQMGCGPDGEEECESILRPELRLIAQAELREDVFTRSHGLAQMRQWIDMHPDITNCRKGIL